MDRISWMDKVTNEDVLRTVTEDKQILNAVWQWTLQKEDIRRLEAFEMWIWRRMMKVLWTEHKTNEEVLQMVDAEREMMDMLRSRQKRWFGYIFSDMIHY